MSKFILFEGLDNTGKTTQMKNLLSCFLAQPTFSIHFSGIKNITNQQAINYNKIFYNDLFQLMKESNGKRNLICDRSHIGEYVYGFIYRKYNPDYIFEIENKWKNEDFWKNIYLITFVDDVENVIKREDGESFSIEKVST